MLKTYYTVKEKKTIKESYYQIQKVFQKDTVRKNDVDEIAKTYNYRVLISDGSGTIVYSSEGEKSLTVSYTHLMNIQHFAMKMAAVRYILSGIRQ